MADAVRIAAQTFFEDRKARYEEFTIGKIRVLPGEIGARALARDYGAMRDMIFGDYPSFDAVLAELAKIDAIINQP